MAVRKITNSTHYFPVDTRSNDIKETLKRIDELLIENAGKIARLKADFNLLKKSVAAMEKDIKGK